LKSLTAPMIPRTSVSRSSEPISLVWCVSKRSRFRVLGILNADILEDIVHLITGGLLAYVGFGRTDLAFARSVVLVLGVIYLVVGLLGFVVPTLFGLLPDGYTIFDNLLHLALSIASIAVALFGRGSVAAARG
jgi:uncharacterized protein DUF4383